jgi:hypothetical protein
MKNGKIMYVVTDDCMEYYTHRPKLTRKAKKMLERGFRVRTGTKLPVSEDKRRKRVMLVSLYIYII